MLLAGAAAGWVGYQFDWPWPIHLTVAILAGMVAGALWGGLAGVLKARTGAHEVIVTIMLNYVGVLPGVLRPVGAEPAPGARLGQPEVARRCTTRRSMPKLLGDRYNLHLGFLLALVAVAVVWWILNRSSLGFRIRAVGENPAAARSSGIDVGRTYIVVMLISGALVGLAGANQVLGTVTSGIIDRPRRRHRLRRHHGRPAGPVETDRHHVGRAAVRRLQGRRLRHAGLAGHPRRHRAGRAVPDRVVHRRPAADPGDLPTACEGGRQ